MTSIQIDPLAFSAGPLSVTWYAVSYVFGVCVVMLYARRLASGYWRPSQIQPQHVTLLIVSSFFMMLLLARFGYALIYEPTLFLDPLSLFAIWRGGLSFHGGLVGAALGCVLFAHRSQIPVLVSTDLLCAGAPLAIAAGPVGRTAERRSDESSCLP